MKICFVAPRFPFPITKGDTLRAYHQIKELSRHHSVHLIAAAQTMPSEADLAELKRYCERVDVVRVAKSRSYATVAALGLQSKLPLQVLYFLSPDLRAAVRRALTSQRFDVVHAMTFRVMPAIFGLADVPVVVDFMDSYIANIATRRLHVGPLTRRVYDFEYPRVARYEADVARRADGGIVIAELDRKSIGDPSLAIIPNGVDIDALAFHDGERDPAKLVFTGNMGYQPNIDAVTWFAQACWPALRERLPNLKFSIVGARPAASVVALGRIPGIEVTGGVESMAPYLNSAAVAVCPIRCGSGMQNKILEAMSAGVPVVTTAFANRSIGSTPGVETCVAADNDAAEFVQAVLGLLSDAPRARRQALAARAFVETKFAWSHRAHQLVGAYKNAIERHARRADLPAAG